MKKTLFIVFVLLCALAFASAQEEITWEKVLKANDPMNVIETYGAMNVFETDGGGSMTLFMEDGDFRWIYNGNNLIDGVNYDYDVYEKTAYVSVIAPDTEPIYFVREHLWDSDIRDFEPTDQFEMKDGWLCAESEYTDEYYGFHVEAEFFLNAQTLLIEKIVSKSSYGWFSARYEERAVYGGDVEIVYDSYPVITQAEDAVDLTVHYPGGETKRLHIARDSQVYVREGMKDWSLCLTAEGEGRIDDLSWVEGDQADVYVVSGYAAPAKPTLSRVIENSSRENVMEKNYGTMNISLWYYDPDGNDIMSREIGWYLTEKNLLELYHETRNADFEVNYSSAASGDALYEWDEEDGYSVTFFSDFSYAENALSGIIPVLDETTLTDNFLWNENTYCWCIPGCEELEGGGRREYVYNVDNEYDMISYLTFADYDKDGALILTGECDIYGNSGEKHERDVCSEFEKARGAKKIKLTVVAPDGAETVYNVRSDASVSWEGKSLYQDAQCTLPVTDLEWVDGRKAVVYAGK